MKKTVLDRFWGKIEVDKTTGCWLWTGHVNKINGYGQFWDGSKVVGVHQFSFMTFKGPLPEGKEPDHECRIRRCGNPAHLRALTRRENLLAGDTIPARNASKTHCQNGHPLSGANLYRARNGSRTCRICRRANSISWSNNNRKRRRALDRQSYRRRMESR